ncbi:MAG TPA: hypothetical protein VHQ47_17485 [Phycisphaerae bacterium]|nr:hypothetical protein [Phycisphaerae bacterium]
MSTSVKSRKSSTRRPESRPTARPALDRPFPPALLRRARAIAASYQFVLWQEGGRWYGRGVELPNAMNDGKTPDQCIANVRDMFVSVIATMLEQGQNPPAPAALS